MRVRGNNNGNEGVATREYICTIFIVTIHT
jgi:hypothetical protein